ncbi:hypothetical protein [Actinoplanes sp. NPDC049118]|uniref:hypothetical protein n=1 Tax=Actinoplanes sp. NPDC049118 TaxID=3155769 RepID=UPI0033F30AA1
MRARMTKWAPPDLWIALYGTRLGAELDPTAGRPRDDGRNPRHGVAGHSTADDAPPDVAVAVDHR